MRHMLHGDQLQPTTIDCICKPVTSSSTTIAQSECCLPAHPALSDSQ